MERQRQRDRERERDREIERWRERKRGFVLKGAAYIDGEISSQLEERRRNLCEKLRAGGRESLKEMTADSRQTDKEKYLNEKTEWKCNRDRVLELLSSSLFLPALSAAFSALWAS